MAPTSGLTSGALATPPVSNAPILLWVLLVIFALFVLAGLRYLLSLLLYSYPSILAIVSRDDINDLDRPDWQIYLARPLMKFFIGRPPRCDTNRTDEKKENLDILEKGVAQPLPVTVDWALPPLVEFRAANDYDLQTIDNALPDLNIHPSSVTDLCKYLDVLESMKEISTPEITRAAIGKGSAEEDEEADIADVIDEFKYPNSSSIPSFSPSLLVVRPIDGKTFSDFVSDLALTPPVSPNILEYPVVDKIPADVLFECDNTLVEEGALEHSFSFESHNKALNLPVTKGNEFLLPSPKSSMIVLADVSLSFSDTEVSSATSLKNALKAVKTTSAVVLITADKRKEESWILAAMLALPLALVVSAPLWTEDAMVLTGLLGLVAYSKFTN